MSVSDLKEGSSELRRFLTADLFKKIYTQFMIQADKNSISKKANGTRIPQEITFEDKNIIDGGFFSQHFGQGSASKTPYISWHVVSVYYVVDSFKIVIGIEEDRYPFLDKMQPLKTVQLGNKKTKVAIFYEISTENIDFHMLHKKFIDVSEEVMSIGI